MIPLCISMYKIYIYYIIHNFVCNYIVRGSWTIQSNIYVWGWYMLVWQINLRYSTLQVLGCRHDIAEYSWHKFIELRKMYALACGFKQTCFCFIPTNGMITNSIGSQSIGGANPTDYPRIWKKGKITGNPHVYSQNEHGFQLFIFFPFTKPSVQSIEARLMTFFLGATECLNGLI